MISSKRHSELGGARLKFVIVILLLGVGGLFAYHFVPVAYQSYQLKDLMQHYVDTAVATNKPGSWIRDQLIKNSEEYGIPPNAVIEPAHADDRMAVRVAFRRPIDFPGYVYEYEFDYTARSTAFLSLGK